MLDVCILVRICFRKKRRKEKKQNEKKRTSLFVHVEEKNENKEKAF